MAAMNREIEEKSAVPGTIAVAEIETVANAQDATEQEQELSLLEAVRMYPKAMFWSFVMSTAVVMEGYDTKLIGTLFAQPVFQKKYGHLVKKPDSYQISAPWQTGLSNGSACGQLVGLLLAGYLSERLGFRKTIIGGLFGMSAILFITFFAPNLTVLVVGQTLLGVPLAIFQVTTVIYALELAPLKLRAYFTNYVNFCWAFGQLIATGILRGMLSQPAPWAYRIPFAIQWFWPVLLIPLNFFAPESPWWLVRAGRKEEARRVLERLVSPRNVNYDLDKNIDLMVVTTEHERRIQSETTYISCFKGVNLRRTLIVLGIYSIQTFNGNPLRGYSTYFLQQAGVPTTQAFNLTIVGFAVAILGGFFSWVLLQPFGRRSIYFWSLVQMCVLLFLIGILGVLQAQDAKKSYPYAIGSLLIVSSFLYNCSIGPLTNTLCSEIPSSILRSKSIALARWTYIITTIIAGVLTPYQLNPTAWNWGAKTGFFWGGSCFLSALFAYFFVPEPKGRTTAELDILFETRVSARHFATTAVSLPEALIGNSKLDEDV